MVLAIAQSVFTGFGNLSPTTVSRTADQPSSVLHSGYWGVHDADIPKDNPKNTGMFWIFINGVVYNPLLALVKISALLFLLRLVARGTQRVACQALIVFNAVQLVTFLSIALLQCVPLEAAWTMSSKDRCIRRRDVYSTALAVTNIVTDILTLLVPYWLFRGLKMHRRARIALLSVFMLGIMFVLASPRVVPRRMLTLVQSDNHLGRPTLLHHSSVLYHPRPRHALRTRVHHVVGRDQPRHHHGLGTGIVATGAPLVPGRV